MTQDHELKLLPCPFCGYKNIILGHVRESDDENFVDYEYLCEKCNGAGPLSTSKGEALDGWNTRQPAKLNVKKLEEIIGDEVADAVNGHCTHGRMITMICKTIITAYNAGELWEDTK